MYGIQKRGIRNSNNKKIDVPQNIKKSKGEESGCQSDITSKLAENTKWK